MIPSNDPKGRDLVAFATHASWWKSAHPVGADAGNPALKADSAVFAARGCCTNPFKRHANARSSTTLPSTALNRLVMTEMTSRTGRCSGENDSCDSLLCVIPRGRSPSDLVVGLRNPACASGSHRDDTSGRGDDIGQASGLSFACYAPSNWSARRRGVRRSRIRWPLRPSAPW